MTLTFLEWSLEGVHSIVPYIREVHSARLMMMLLWRRPLSLLLLVLVTPALTTLASVSVSAMTTPVEEVPKIVARVASKSDEWKSLPLDTKIELLKQVLSNTIQYQDEWTKSSCQDRGISATDVRHGCARADVLTVSQATLGSYLNGILSCLAILCQTRRHAATTKINTNVG